MEKKINVLLTNDDGYTSRGLHILKEQLKGVGNIYVFAPKEAMSGKGCASTFFSGITFEKIEENVYAVNGTPADCVSFGVFYLKKYFNIDIDLVISGCNAGSNITYDTLYSGTIGACIDASKYKIPSIAFSAPDDFRFVEEHCLEVYEYIVKNNLISQECIVSVNFPYSKKIDGIKMATLYKRNDKHYFVEKDGKFYAKREDEQNVPIGSDCYYVDHSNYICITLLNNSLGKK